MALQRCNELSAFTPVPRLQIVTIGKAMALCERAVHLPAPARRLLQTRRAIGWTRDRSPRSATRTAPVNGPASVQAVQRINITPARITPEATAFPVVIRSPKTSQPISTANRIEVSRSAATTAIGATVIAQIDTA
jgi:hypothetical protein